MSLRLCERWHQRSWEAAHDNFVRGSKGEARAHNGKIEQSQARD